MRHQLHKGQQVTVNAFSGKHPIVTVVEDLGDVVLICKPEEYAAAVAENRRPIAIGFHREDVLEVLNTTRKSVSSQSRDEHRSSMAGD